MDEKKQRRIRRPRNNKYVPRTNAVHITIHSQDGNPVPRSVLDQATRAVEEVATKNRLLINVAET